MKTKRKPPCKFGEVLLEILNKHGLNSYDIERKSGISAATIQRFVHCFRFPTPFEEAKAIKITDLAKIIGMDKKEKSKLYKALVETFYPGLIKYFKDIDESKLTDDYIIELVNKKPANKSWSDIYKIIPESTVRKIRNLGTDVAILKSKNTLNEYIQILNISDRERAEVLYFFLKKKGAEEEFLRLLKE